MGLQPPAGSETRSRFGTWAMQHRALFWPESAWLKLATTPLTSSEPRVVRGCWCFWPAEHSGQTLKVRERRVNAASLEAGPRPTGARAALCFGQCCVLPERWGWSEWSLPPGQLTTKSPEGFLCYFNCMLIGNPGCILVTASGFQRPHLSQTLPHTIQSNSSSFQT